MRGIINAKQSSWIHIKSLKSGQKTVFIQMFPPIHIFRYLLPLLLGLACAFSAQAARPMLTDDARIVDAKSCQLETWVRQAPSDTQYWALPGCNFTGNLELTVGGATTHNAEGTHTTDLVVQGKTLFQTLEPNGWAWGLAVGNIQHPQLDKGLRSDVYAYVPASFSFRDDRTVVHSNLGWARAQPTHRDMLTWGVGLENQLNQRTWLIAESFGQNEGKPFMQFGLRYWIVPNHVQIDTTYGNRIGGASEERWMSIGLRLLSLPFLP